MAHAFFKKMLDGEDRSFRLRSFLCLAGTFFLFNSLIAQWIGVVSEIHSLLALLGALLLGAPLVYQAVGDLFRAKSDMNELAALSFLAAFVTGEYRTAGAIAFFMIISLLIEYRSELGARKNLEALLKLTPQKACLLKDGRESQVLAADLHPGDWVRVRPGDKIPADAVIRTGSGFINEASITGESLPVEKRQGDGVFAGSINTTGSLELEVVKPGEDSILAKIRGLIMEAEKSQSAAMQLIDRYASYYTPIILMIAALVLFFTREGSRAISVLIIACPCTILLSIPSAKIAALSAAAGLGVIIKNIAGIEKAAKVDSFVFDKTGTLTTGVLQVVKIAPAPGISEEELLQSAASVEYHSRHPVAAAVVRMARERQLSLEDCGEFTETAGFGVRSEHVLCGNEDYLRKNGFSPSDYEIIEGYTLLLVVRDGCFMGALYLADAIREDARKVLQELRAAGAEHLVMLTGDREAAARKCAEYLDCELEAQVLPADKLQRVKALQRQGHVVAVIGDGVNDAPALAAGDISIAMGAAGSDVAIHSASVVLLNNQLNRIGFLWELARETCLVMRQNLIFSACYILVLMILSIAGAIPPVWAAVLHTVSGLGVVLNSSRLFRKGEELL